MTLGSNTILSRVPLIYLFNIGMDNWELRPTLVVQGLKNILYRICPPCKNARIQSTASTKYISLLSAKSKLNHCKLRPLMCQNQYVHEYALSSNYVVFSIIYFTHLSTIYSNIKEVAAWIMFKRKTALILICMELYLY